MGFMGKLIFAGAFIGTGAYIYDLNYAERKLVNATVTLVEAEQRCKWNHEAMCKYHATVKLKKPVKQEYRYRIPYQYYHSELLKKDDRVTVTLKMKKIFPPRILGLTEKEQTKIDEMIAKDKI